MKSSEALARAIWGWPRRRPGDTWEDAGPGAHAHFTRLANAYLALLREVGPEPFVVVPASQVVGADRLAEAMHNVRNHGPHDSQHLLVAHPHALDTSAAEPIVAEVARLAAAPYFGRWYPEMPPLLPGEDAISYTDRLIGAAGPDSRPPYDHVRNRQCSIGYHEECTDQAGLRCRCPCHEP